MLIWKNCVLDRQEHARVIDEVNDAECALECDSVITHDFLCCLWKERSGLHGFVVGNDHAWNTSLVADTCHDSGCWNFSPLLVHFVSSPETDLEKLGIFVQQVTEPFAHW